MCLSEVRRKGEVLLLFVADAVREGVGVLVKGRGVIWF